MIKRFRHLAVASLNCMFGFSSCAQDHQDWQIHDPNDGAEVANDMSNPRYYNTDSLGNERRALEGWEQRDSKEGDRNVRFSGEVSLGVRSRF